jgi:nucleoside-diphosphate-sugar epimerase
LARILIAGCGYVGTALGVELVRHEHDVWGLRRKVAALPPGIKPLEADLGLPGTLRELPPELEYVVYLASPSGADDALYRAAYADGLHNLLSALDAAGQRPRRLLFASSTAVYGQQGGEWVDETSPTEPRHFSGRRLLQAEERLAASGWAATVVRFGGIYGPRRMRLVDAVRSGRATYPPDPPRYANRIHRDDCVGVLHHLLKLPSPESLYLGVDCEPVDRATLFNWLAGALGAPPPRRAHAPDTQASRGNKRCRNERLLASGYTFRHPTFREGYSALLADAS